MLIFNHKHAGAVLLLASLNCAAATQTADSPWLSRLLLNSIPSLNVAADQLRASSSPAHSGSLTYARSAELSADLQHDGVWSEQAGQAIWRLKLHSDEARSISLTLSDLKLPSAAQLRIYDGAGQLWHGPLHAAQLQTNERYWTPIVPGDTLLLELSLPSTDRASSQLRVGQLHHADKDWNIHSKSGSCNIDVACSEADAWTDAVRATARITIGGKTLCSAVLLNNTAQDGTPLLLTAKHCGIGENAESPASSVVVYWNYETSQCGGSADGNLRQNQSGGQLLADNARSDFSLVQLDQVPAANYQVYYAGWDARAIASPSGVGVHHPSGDEKRISFYDTLAQPRAANVDGATVDSWQVRWDRGITESGSSGSGLFNGNHQVIGQLSGGNSSCAQTKGADVYGRFDISWNGDSQPQLQLQTWLDPIDSGVTTLAGLDSRNATVKAFSDEYTAVPADSQALQLDVLSNDAGALPLRLISASSDHGLVHIQGQHLFYEFADGADQAQLQYQIINRWGETDSATVQIKRLSAPKAAPRGGSLDFLLLAITMLAALRKTSLRA